MTAQRNITLDVIKGVLIWLVVFGHSIQFVQYPDSAGQFRDPIFTFIYMFHMPLFMALSGYFFNAAKAAQTGVGTFIAQRGRAIIVPAITWGLIATSVGVTYAGLTGTVSLGKATEILLMMLANGYWFLWAVFLSYLALRLLMMLPIPLGLSGPVLAALLILLPLHEVPRISDMLLLFSFTFPFFLAGHYARTLGEQGRLSTHRPLTHLAGIGLCTGFLILFATWQPEYFAYRNQMNILAAPKPVLMTLVGGILGSLSIVWLLSLAANARPIQPAVQWFSALGQNSLQIYLMQGFAFLVIDRLVPASLTQLPTPVLLGLCIALTFCLVALMQTILRAQYGPRKMQRLLWGR